VPRKTRNPSPTSPGQFKHSKSYVVCPEGKSHSVQLHGLYRNRRAGWYSIRQDCLRTAYRIVGEAEGERENRNPSRLRDLPRFRVEPGGTGVVAEPTLLCGS